MKIEEDIKLDFNDVLLRPKRSVLNSRSDVFLERTFVFKNSNRTWTGVPIIASNMDTIGTYEVYKVLSEFKILTAFHKFYSADDFSKMELNPEYFMISTGISDNDLERLQTITSKIEVKFICVDVANGYMKQLINFCKRLRELYPDKIIVAGNVVTREIVEELVINGLVDIVKVGIGGGSACLTRLKTGVGMPQLSAIMECADAAHGLNSYIIGDGGITCPGDMTKAFGGGADFVMVGGQFSGHDENPGELIEENGQKYKLFYGMSSDTAMNKHYGQMAHYRSSEGRTIKVKYRGPLKETVMDYLGGVRSACTYINAKCIKDISKCCTFVRVNRQLNNIFNN
jgi:GMP reductase